MVNLKVVSFFFPVLGLGLLMGAGCAQERTLPVQPTLAVAARLTVVSSPTASPTTMPSETPVPAADAAVTHPASFGETGTETAQTPSNVSGVSMPAIQAQLLSAPETGLDTVVDWRPPPVPVPHALHPDDHYWLARPIPSDRRNYELEWYPYGNQPMRSAALPYRVHHGMDFPNTRGSTIFAAGSGTVVWAGPMPNPVSGINYYGNTVVVRHDWEWQDQPVYTLYAHTLELFVEVGDDVEQGQLLAGVGASGEVTGPHLHLEVRVGLNSYDSTRNPALWLAPFEGWGTLAGRFIDSSGKPIHGALVTVVPEIIESAVEVPIRRQQTYLPSTVNPDDVWQENFVVGDLPAGRYELILQTAGETFRRTVDVKPGITNFVIVQADFPWYPTAVPTSTPTPTPALDPDQTSGPPGAVQAGPVGTTAP